MCGHGVIALGRYAIDYKLVRPVSPETQVKIQCPCGLVTAHVEYDAETGKTGQTRFESVPAFAFSVDQTIQVGEPYFIDKQKCVEPCSTPPFLCIMLKIWKGLGMRL